MRLIAAAIYILASITTSGQINLEDSTVQVIGFWDKNEKQIYAVSLEKISVKGTDTTSREMIRYDVEVTIKDSTANSYLIEWFYRNFTIDSPNKVTQKLMSAAQDIRVLILTDEFGGIKGVENWKEVRDYIKASTSKLKRELKDVPKIDEIITQMENTYSTKAGVEAQAILDAQQFYTFHGARYKLNEVLSGQLKTANLLGSEPFDTEFIVSLDEINAEDNNYILRSSQVVNADQLAEATYLYLVNLSKKMGVAAPGKETVKDITNETLTASRIHGSGWLVYSILTKTVRSNDQSNIEERIIEIK